MGAISDYLHIGGYMITSQDKIEIILNKLNVLEFIIESYITHADDFKNKYSLDDELQKCNMQKNVLLAELDRLKNNEDSLD